MRVWQAGSHLTMQRGAEVEGLVVAAHGRAAISTLARLTTRYKRADDARGRLARSRRR